MGFNRLNQVKFDRSVLKIEIPHYIIWISNFNTDLLQKSTFYEIFQTATILNLFGACRISLTCDE